MPYEDDEARRAARARLQARMEKRASADGSVQKSPTASRGMRQSSRQTSERASKSAPTRSAGHDSRRSARSVSQRATRTQNRRQHAPITSTYRTRSGRALPSSSPASAFDAVIEKLPSGVPPIALPIAGAAILLIIILIVAVPRCSGSQQVDEPANGQAQQAQSANTSSNAGSNSSTLASPTTTVTVDESNDLQRALVDLIGKDETAKLLASARTDSDALWIAAHPEQYAFDGIEVQQKILKLAADEPASLKYVREFPAQYPSSEAKADGSIAMDSKSPSSDVPDTNIPHFYQWDRRWGNTVYSSAAFGLTGCGPTSFAMVYQGVTGATDKTPYDFGKLAQERNYMSEYEGTASEFFTGIAEEFGMSCELYYPSADTITQLLSGGATIIANLGPGQFTQHGHFFVLAGLDSSGKVIVNDPYSVVRSSQTWDADTIAGDAIALYAYTSA